MKKGRAAVDCGTRIRSFSGVDAKAGDAVTMIEASAQNMSLFKGSILGEA
jgi:hypothetical protein